jgi:hypothetical protein
MRHGLTVNVTLSKSQLGDGLRQDSLLAVQDTDLHPFIVVPADYLHDWLV